MFMRRTAARGACVKLNAAAAEKTRYYGASAHARTGASRAYVNGGEKKETKAGAWAGGGSVQKRGVKIKNAF